MSIEILDSAARRAGGVPEGDAVLSKTAEVRCARFTTFEDSTQRSVDSFLRDIAE